MLPEIYLLSGLAIFAYFVGAIPFALIIAKAKKVDLRSVGSGNIGATNLYRAVGLKYGLVCFLLDLSKGFLPTYLAMAYFSSPIIHVGIGFVAIVGHSLTVFAKFKGGKGAATGLGVLLAISLNVFAILFIVGVCVIALTRMVAPATILCSLLAPILLYGLRYPVEYTAFVGVIALFIIVRHRANIIRILQRKENKV